MKRNFLLSAAIAASLLAACGQQGKETATVAKATVYDQAAAQAFLAEAEAELMDAAEYASRASWLAATYINDDSQFVEAKSAKDYTLAVVKYAKQVKNWDGAQLDPVTRRKLDALRLGLSFPSPDDEKLAGELADIGSKMQGMYGAGKYCRDNGECLDLIQMSNILAEGKDPALMQEVWTGWRSVSPPMRPLYQRQVEIANAGARDLGFDNLSVLWRSNYDMAPDAFAADVDQQWNKVKPLYDALHCHVRAKLNETYGDAVVPASGKIPAHMLGNMWAQTWGNVYDKVKPANSQQSYDLTKLIEQSGMNELGMVRTAEAFFSSLVHD